MTFYRSPKEQRLPMDYKITVLRFNPEKDSSPHAETYEVAGRDGWTVLDALHQIKWKQDGTLAFRRSCRHGICGSCAMTIDGLNRLACETQLSSLPPAFAVEPLRGLPVIKDLVVEMDAVYAAVTSVRPWLENDAPPPTDAERTQSPADRARLDGLYECILCACCTGSCPSFWADKKYLGPHALLRAARFWQDTRDRASGRLEVVDHRHGVWRCHTIYNCAEACPKGLNPAEAIAGLRRGLVKTRY